MRKRASSPRSRPFLNQEILGCMTSRRRENRKASTDGIQVPTGVQTQPTAENEHRAFSEDLGPVQGKTGRCLEMEQRQWANSGADYPKGAQETSFPAVWPRTLSPYLRTTPDSTAEDGIVACNDGAVCQGLSEAWGFREVQGLVLGWLICDACWRKVLVPRKSPQARPSSLPQRNSP